MRVADVGGRAAARLRRRFAPITARVAETPARAVARPRAALAVAAALVVICAVASLRLTPSASPELLVDPGSQIGRATTSQQRAFGAEPIVIVVRGRVATDILAPPNLVALLALEGRAARLAGVRTVFGPGTFVNQTIVQAERLLERELGPVARRAAIAAERARRRALAAGATRAEAERAADRARLRELEPVREQLSRLFVRYGYIGLPSLSNRNFTTALVLGASTEPKRRFRWLFPDADHALVVVRPKTGLPDARIRALGRRLEALAHEARLDGVQLTVAGAPLIAAAVDREVTRELAILAPVGLLGMALALLACLRGGAEALRPLMLAGLAVLVTSALSWALGLGLTPATLAALPVVLGLAVDFAVQLQARFWALSDRGRPPPAAALQATRALAPVLGLAALAMAGGFLVLTLSPVPLIDRLGQTLAVGTLASVAVVLGLGGALLAAGRRGRARVPVVRLPRVRWRPSVRRWALAAVAVAAAVGIALSGEAQVESDLTRLAPPGLEELRRSQSVQRELGTAGQLRIAVRARDVTDPRVLAWMKRVEDRVLALRRDLRPGPSLAALLLTGLSEAPSRQQVDALLRIIPGYFLSAVVTRDRHAAEMSFGVPLVPLAEQARLLDEIEDILERAPPGVEARPAGLVAMAAASVRDLEGQRPWLLLAAGLAVFCILLAARRDATRAALPLVPAMLAAGVSSLALLALGIQLSPLSAALEPLVLAVGVEFGLLLEARYREARAAGEPPAAARAEALERVGGAVAVSAATVAVGFAALTASRMPLLREFGILVAMELALCLLAAVLAVPALAEYLDRRALRRRAAGAPPRRPSLRPPRLPSVRRASGGVR